MSLPSGYSTQPQFQWLLGKAVAGQCLEILPAGDQGANTVEALSASPFKVFV
jgi:hypothetical protein